LGVPLSNNLNKSDPLLNTLQLPGREGIIIALSSLNATYVTIHFDEGQKREVAQFF